MSFFLPDNEKMQLTERVSCIFDPVDKALLLSEQAADGIHYFRELQASFRSQGSGILLTNQREESIEGQIRECTAFAEKNQLATGNTCLVLMIA